MFDGVGMPGVENGRHVSTDYLPRYLARDI